MKGRFYPGCDGLLQGSGDDLKKPVQSLSCLRCNLAEKKELRDGLFGQAGEGSPHFLRCLARQQLLARLLLLKGL